MSTVGDAIAAGRLAVGTLTQPFLKNGLDSGKVRVLGYSATAIAPRFTMTAWFAKDDFVTRVPSFAATFVRTMHDAAVYTNAHHAETAPMLANFLSVPADDITSVGFRVTAGTSLTPQLMKPLIDAAAHCKVITPRSCITRR